MPFSETLWVIDPETGATSAALLDGSGGAFVSEDCDFGLVDGLNALLSLLGLVCTVAGPAAGPAAWFCLGVTVASVLVTAGAVLEGGVNEGTPFGVFGLLFGASYPPPFTLLTIKYVPPKIAPFAGRIGVAGVVLLLTLISIQCFK